MWKQTNVELVGLFEEQTRGLVFRTFSAPPPCRTCRKRPCPSAPSAHRGSTATRHASLMKNLPRASWTIPSPWGTRSPKRESPKEPTLDTSHTTPTVFTSRTFPVAGQKASEAAFTDSTEEKESLTINSTLCYLPGLDGGSNFRELDVHNIAKRVLSVVSNSNNSGLSSSVLRNIAKWSITNTSIHSWSFEK